MTYFILFLVILLLGYVIKNRRAMVQFESTCKLAFEDSFKSTIQKPAFQMLYLYGMPAFSVIHITKDDYELSQQEGAHQVFTAAVQKLCQHYGSKERPYDTSRAICFAWAKDGNALSQSATVLSSNVAS